MRTWYFPCLLALSLLQPRWCLAQAVADEARIDGEMQEDVEVLRRIVTETVQGLYRKADQRALRNCTACHVVPESFSDEYLPKDTSSQLLAAALTRVADPHSHVLRGH